MDKWIDAKVELPDDDMLVLACDQETERFWLATHSGRHWYDDAGAGTVPVSHWMDLPAMPAPNNALCADRIDELERERLSICNLCEALQDSPRSFLQQMTAWAARVRTANNALCVERDDKETP